MKKIIRVFFPLFFLPAIAMTAEGMVFAFNGSHLLPEATDSMQAARAWMTWLFTSLGIVGLAITWEMK